MARIRAYYLSKSLMACPIFAHRSGAAGDHAAICPPQPGDQYCGGMILVGVGIYDLAVNWEYLRPLLSATLLMAQAAQTRG
jgi:hypothetical protein